MNYHKMHVYMDTNKKIYIIIFSIFFCLNLHSQQKIIDSLEVIITDKNIVDRDKIIPLARLGTAYVSSTSKLDKALTLIKKATELAKAEKDAKYATYSYSQLASLYSNLDSISLAYTTIDTCLMYIAETNDIDIKCDALTTLARSKLIFGDHTGVLDMLLQAYDLQKDDKTGIKLSPIYFMLYVYYSSSDLDKTKEYANLTLKESLKTKDYNAISRGWSAVGAASYITSNKNERDSAVYAFRQSINTYEEYSSEVEYTSCVVSLLNMANIFFEQQDEKGRLLHPDSILYYARKAEKIALEMNDVQFTASVIPLIANVQHNEGKILEAEQTLIRGINYLSDKNGFSGEKEYLHKTLCSLYKKKGDYRNALVHKEKEAEYRSQINEQMYIREGRMTEAKYKIKENESQLKISQEEADRHKKFLIGGVIAAIVLIVVLFLFYRMRLKNIKQKAELHEKEKEEIRLLALLKDKELQQAESEKKALQLEKELEEEKAERQTLEINRLHTELIVGISQLSQKSDTLERIKQTIDINKQAITDDLKKILLTDKIADKSFDDFSDLLLKVHPDFFTKLQEYANQKLTSLDLKYCTYILMDFSSKEIANIMHVEPKTARSTKYRLKQKLNLSKEDDLSHFIKEIAKQLPSL